MVFPFSSRSLYKCDYFKLECGFILTGHNFRTFLQQHIDLAYGKGFEDNVNVGGRHNSQGYFEVNIFTLRIFIDFLRTPENSGIM